jgi:hypothetical protein
VDDLLKHDKEFRYQLLDRMKQDCEYFLGHGNRYPQNLWAGNEAEQIGAMKLLWNSFDANEKPEWLAMEKIIEYEKAMIHAD